MLAAEGTGPAWGIEIEEAREGYARIRMTLTAAMLNGHGIAHGGMVFALADTAFAYACNSRNLRSVAAQASIIFLDQAREGEVLIAEAPGAGACRPLGRYPCQRPRPRTAAPSPSSQGFSRSLGGALIGDERMTEAFICDAVRTPIGRYGGSLAHVRADDLAAIPIRALIERNPRRRLGRARRRHPGLRQPGRRGQSQPRPHGRAARRPSRHVGRRHPQPPVRLGHGRGGDGGAGDPRLARPTC